MSEGIPSDSFDTDIAVVGMAGRFAGAADLATYWRHLRDGVESIETFTDEQLLAAGVDPALVADPAYVKRGAVLPDMEGFDAPFFGLNPREGSIMDPQHRHFLECAWEALEDAGHMPERFEGSIGVFGGSGHNAYMPYNLLTNPKLMRSVGFFLVRHTGNDKDFLTTRVSYALNLRGPSVNVQTACSTSLVAIHMAAQSLLNRECDMALAGGVTIELPHRHGYLYQDGEILSPDGHCHSFDANSKGTVFSSGAGVVVLRRLSDALADGDHIHAVIKGSAVNNDGSGKVGYLAPSVDGQAQAIAEAISLANVPADSITLVEAHGTGTPVGDPIEVSALTQAFRQTTDKTGFCAIGSVKSNIGHADTAAGVAAFMKVALALQHRQIPPSLNFRSPNPACRFDSSPFFVADTLRPWTPPRGVPRRAGVSSLGVGGTNAHIVLEEAPPRGSGSAPTRALQVLALSARTPTALKAATQRLADHLERSRQEATMSRPAPSLADVAYTLQQGRQPMAHRRVLVADSLDSAVARLRETEDGPLRAAAIAEDLREVAFLFAGGGAQHPRMGEGLYRGEPVYRAVIDEGLALVRRFAGLDLAPLLMPAAGDEAAAAAALERPSRALPALLMAQVAQARLMMAWGLEPAAMIGHSMGEYTAAHLAGVFSFEDALRLVFERGRLFETLPEGAMLSVPLPVDELRPRLSRALSVSVVNGPRMTVIGGPVADIEALQAGLAADEIEAVRVRISVAAHSSMLESILEPFAAFLRTIRMRPPERRFVSNLSGTWITPQEAVDPSYWVRHLRETVRFAEGLQCLLDDPSRVLLEVGPGRVMGSLARQHPGRSPRQPVLSASRHVDDVVDDQAHALAVFGRLWAHGLAVDWSALRPDERRLKVPLPTYAFDHQRLWIEPGEGAAASIPAAERSLTRRPDLADWVTVPTWLRRPLPIAPPVPGSAPVLVFCDGRGLSDRLVDTLRRQGRRVATVRPGARFQRRGEADFVLPGSGPADHEALVAALGGAIGARSDQPLEIIHAWNVSGDAAMGLDARQAEAWLPLGFYSLLHLAQALGNEDWSAAVRWLVLSDGLQRVAGEPGLSPLKATLLGPCRVIPQEFPHWKVRSLDLELPSPEGGARAWSACVDQVLAEAAALAGERPASGSQRHDEHGASGVDDDLIALRQGERWALGRAARPLPLVPADRSPWSAGRTVLITGGLGGVGLALARQLADRGGVRLALVGRSALPEPAGWAGWIESHAADDPVSRRLQELQAMRAQGVQVSTHAADITDLSQMQRVLREVVQVHGGLHGVLHAAGVLQDGPIQLKEASDAAAVLAPKVQGTLVLEQALRQAGLADGLDFVVLFSSISSFAGLAGQVDYAAANAFLDAFAQSRARRSAGSWIAVDWAQWAEVGMAAELARRLGISADDSLPEPGAPGTRPLGLSLLGHVLVSDARQRVYQTAFSIDTHWLLSEHRVRGGEALIPGTGFLEIVRTGWAQTVPAGAALELREVSFLAPFAVPPGVSRDLRVHFEPAGRSDRSNGSKDASLQTFTVKGRALDGTGWVECVRGVVGSADASAQAARAAVDVAAIRSRCAQGGAVDPARQPAHLVFGPRWANLHRLDRAPGEALLTLELAPAFAADLREHALHPALLDLATAGAQSLLPGFDEERDFFVPGSYGLLRQWAPLPQRLVSHVRLKAGAEAVPGSARVAVYDVTLMDEQGRVVVDIVDFAMVRIQDKSFSSLSATPTPAGEPAQARAVANPLLSLGLQEGIRPQEGLEILERAIAWQAGPQIAVSPHDLDVLLARLRPDASATPTAAESVPDGDDPSWRAPSTPMEKLIAQLWADLLGLPRVSATGNFFDLGGHSLLAVQVITRLRKRTGKPLALTALMQAPTVETLAALIDPEGAALAAAGAVPANASGAPGAATAANALTLRTPSPMGSRIIVPIRPGGDGPPLFFVHDGNGETLLYRTLALALEPGRPVLGLQPLQREDGSFVHTQIAEMASHYVQEIRNVQPDGPYHLAGLCAGGVIAFEMARQLQDAGQTTAFLGIIDAADVHAAERRFRIARERLNRFVDTLTTPADLDGPVHRRLGAALPTMARKAVNAARWELESRMNRRRNQQLVEALRDGVSGPLSDLPPIDFLPLYEVAHRQHRPSGLFAGGQVVLFRGQKGDGTVADIPYIEKYSDPLFGWAPRTRESIVVHDIPGGHASLLQAPNVSVLAEAMRLELRRAHARHEAERATTAASRGSAAGGDGPSVAASAAGVAAPSVSPSPPAEVARPRPDETTIS